jgi:hypothetical protein
VVYMRIDKSRYWGLLTVAALAGALVGGGFIYLLGGSAREQLSSLQSQVAAMSATASATAGLQAQLQSAEASVTSLTAQNSQLASDLATAKAASKSGSSSSGSSPSSGGTVSFVSREVQPGSITTTGTMTLVVKLKGSPSSVKMRVVGTNGISFSHSWYLTHTSTSGSTQTWKRTVAAPTTKGDYRFYATAYVGSTSFEMPGVSAWLFSVN